MTEQYDFETGERDRTFFSLYLLEGEVSELTKDPDFDSSDMEVNLTINGHTVRVDDFNKVLDDWSARIESQIKIEMEFNQSEEAVVRKAKELIRERLGNMQEILFDAEQQLWKLEI